MQLNRVLSLASSLVITLIGVIFLHDELRRAPQENPRRRPARTPQAPAASLRASRTCVVGRAQTDRGGPPADARPARCVRSAWLSFGSPKVSARSVRRRALNVLVGDGQIADEAGDKDRQHEANQPRSQPQPAEARWLAEPVGKRSPEWSGHDVGKPEGKNRVQPEQPVTQRREREQGGKQQTGDKVAQM